MRCPKEIVCFVCLEPVQKRSDCEITEGCNCLCADCERLLLPFPAIIERIKKVIVPNHLWHRDAEINHFRAEVEKLQGSVPSEHEFVPNGTSKYCKKCAGLARDHWSKKECRPNDLSIGEGGRP